MSLVTYAYPVAGTTPPTVAQMQVPGGIATMITLTLQMGPSDTLVVITHNMGLTLAEQNNLFPMLVHYFNTYDTAGPFLTFSRPTPSATPANAIVATKSGLSGTDFTATVFILRPHTLIQ